MSNLRISAQTRARIYELWPALLSRIAAGAMIGRELEAIGIGRDSIRAVLADNKDMRAEWDEARTASADAFFDDAIETTYSGGDPKLIRAQVDALLRFAARRNPRTYSERQTLDVNVRSVDLTAIIRDANARLAAYDKGRVIEHDARPALEDQRDAALGAAREIAPETLHALL